MNPEINTYIELRYPRWLDYACYHCVHAKMNNEATDVLNEVIISLLEKDEIKVLKMLNSHKGKYRELDFFVLRMIKLNVYSPTSPYQSKYKQAKTVTEIKLHRLNIPEVEIEDEDRPGRILEQFNQVREIYNNLNLSDKAKKIFMHRFFMGLPFSQWDGPETKKELYETYNKIVELIKAKLNGKSLI